MSLPTSDSARRNLGATPFDLHQSGRPLSAPRKATRPPSAIDDSRSRRASFPLRSSVEQHRSLSSKGGSSIARRVRSVAYVAVALLAWKVFTPTVQSNLSITERALLVCAQDIAMITHSFVPDVSAERFEKCTTLLGSTTLRYEYDSVAPNQPRIAAVVETQSELYRKFAESSLLAALKEIDWRSEPQGTQKMVPMEVGKALGDGSQSYFLYEAGKPVGNCVTVRVGKTTVSLVLGGVLLRDQRELEAVLGPILQKLRGVAAS